MNLQEIAKKAELCTLTDKSWYIASPEKFEKLITTIIAEHEKNQMKMKTPKKTG